MIYPFWLVSAPLRSRLGKALAFEKEEDAAFGSGFVMGCGSLQHAREGKQAEGEVAVAKDLAAGFCWHDLSLLVSFRSLTVAARKDPVAGWIEAVAGWIEAVAGWIEAERLSIDIQELVGLQQDAAHRHQRVASKHFNFSRLGGALQGDLERFADLGDGIWR